MGIDWNNSIYKILRKLGQKTIYKSNYNIEEVFIEEEIPKKEAVV